MIDVAEAKRLIPGITDQEINEALTEISNEEALKNSYNQTMNRPNLLRSNTMVSGTAHYDDLIRWQLELDSILERIEHILKGDKPTLDNGNMVFVPSNDTKDKIFNDYGVSEIMRILTMYLNRNTILSNYDEDTINNKVYDFGCEVSDLIFLKYEDMGMDTLAKRKRYPMIIRELVDTVHSGYLRALNGGERESLRKGISVNQQMMSGMPGQGMPMGMGMQRERSIINPLRYIMGKYK